MIVNDNVKVNILSLGRLPEGLTGPINDITVPRRYYELLKGMGYQVELLEENDNYKEDAVISIPEKESSKKNHAEIEDNTESNKIKEVIDESSEDGEETTETSINKEEVIDETEQSSDEETITESEEDETSEEVSDDDSNESNEEEQSSLPRKKKKKKKTSSTSNKEATEE